jgi:hypothetical protein
VSGCVAHTPRYAVRSGVARPHAMSDEHAFAFRRSHLTPFPTGFIMSGNSQIQLNFAL